MSYKDQCSITKIETNARFQKLSISLEDDFDMIGKPMERVSLLFVPDIQDSDHFHIELTAEGLWELYQWLDEYHGNS